MPTPVPVPMLKGIRRLLAVLSATAATQASAAYTFTTFEVPIVSKGPHQ